MDYLPILTLNDARKVIGASFSSNTVVHLIGPPGIGKSAIVRQLAFDMGVPAYIATVGTYPDSGEICLGVQTHAPGQAPSLTRVPVGMFAKACAIPGILFLDEFLQAPAHVQNALNPVILDHEVGDSLLHPNTRVVLASNPPGQGGEHDQTLPSLGRVTSIRVLPTLDEVTGYLEALTGQTSTLQALAVDLAATMRVDPSLLQIEPPQGTRIAGKPWGAPRSWVRALTLGASILDSGIKDDSPIFGACLAGAVGPEISAAWLAIRRIRHKLASKDEIRTDPLGAKVPTDTETSIAAMGVVAQVALEDPCASWAYANRFTRDELKIALARSLMKYSLADHKKSKFFSEATKARVLILGQLGAAHRDMALQGKGA